MEQMTKFSLQRVDEIAKLHAARKRTVEEREAEDKAAFELKYSVQHYLEHQAAPDPDVHGDLSENNAHHEDDNNHLWVGATIFLTCFIFWGGLIYGAYEIISWIR